MSHNTENDAPTWGSLRAVSPSVWRKHRPVGAYLPVGQLDGDCQCGQGAWPCPDFLAAYARVFPPGVDQ